MESVFDHRLLNEIEDIVQKIHGDELENNSLSRCVDRLGKSLREDYDEDFKQISLEEKQDELSR